MRTRVETEVLTDEQGNLIGEGFVKMKIVQVMEGIELVECLTAGVNHCIDELKKKMYSYNRSSLFNTWFYFVRQIDEFINIRYEFGESCEEVFKCIHLDRKSEMIELSSAVEKDFGADVNARFLELAELFTGYSYEEFDGSKVIDRPLGTLYDLLVFLQSRRLHIMTILNLIPIDAQGDISFCKEDIPRKMDEWIGLLMNITTGCQAILETKCLSDFYAKVTPKGLEFSQQYTHLDKHFLEPQQLTPVELEQYRTDRLESRETKKKRSICSKEELELILRNDKAYNERYGITEKKEYKELVAFMYKMEMYFKDEYVIEVPHNEFERLQETYSNLELYKEITDLEDIENSRYGFVKMDGAYYSTFFMLIRYYTNCVMKMLRRRRKYQIEAGFVFEEQLKSIVRNYGFDVKDDCKRIERKEFDVVCVKNGTIYNFQCKNNYINVSTIGLKETKETCRRNRQLNSYYKAALCKEEGREHLLKKKLGIEKVTHYVISRYPIMSNNERIIPFNKLEEWCEEN